MNTLHLHDYGDDETVDYSKYDGYGYPYLVQGNTGEIISGHFDASDAVKRIKDLIDIDRENEFYRPDQYEIHKYDPSICMHDLLFQDSEIKF